VSAVYKTLTKEAHINGIIVNVYIKGKLISFKPHVNWQYPRGKDKQIISNFN
jgi:hypothetical protein